MLHREATSVRSWCTTIESSSCFHAFRESPVAADPVQLNYIHFFFKAFACYRKSLIKKRNSNLFPSSSQPKHFVWSIIFTFGMEVLSKNFWLYDFHEFLVENVCSANTQVSVIYRYGNGFQHCGPYLFYPWRLIL